VHSFTGDGMLNQLLFFMVVFIWLPFHMLILHRRMQIAFAVFSLILVTIGSLVNYDTILFSTGSLNIGWRGILFILSFVGCYGFLYVSHNKYFPKNPKKQPDYVWSREFWMFTGALLFLLSSVHIIVSTSMPVLNDILGTNFAPVADKDRNEYYADYQVPFAIAIGLLMAMGLYMRYRGNSFKQVASEIIIPVLMALVITIFTAIGYNFGLRDLPLTTLLFVSCALVCANLWYWIKYYRYRITEIGAPLAHVGFGGLLIRVQTEVGDYAGLVRSSFRDPV
jgi:cytochrome c-type biogenesis protein CcmF